MEAFAYYRAVVIHTLGAVHHVTNIEVDAECLSIHRLQQFQIFVRTCGERIGHHLDGKLGLCRLDGIDYSSAVFNGCIHELLAEVLRVRGTPSLGIIGSGNIDTTQRTDFFGKCETLLHVVEILAALLGIELEHIDPGSNFGDDYILAGEFLDDCLGTVSVMKFNLRYIGGAIAESAMFAGKCARKISVQKNRAAKAYVFCLS